MSVKHLVSSKSASTAHFGGFLFWQQPARSSCNWSESPTYLKNIFTLQTTQTMTQFDLDQYHLFLSNQGSAVQTAFTPVI